MVIKSSILQNDWLTALRDKLNEPVDAASIAFFRIIFGCIMLFSQLRFLQKGWVEQLYLRPHFFFKYYGFSWVSALPGKWLYLPWIAMIVSLVLIIIGKYYRVAIIVFFFLFSYTELLDLTNYLNHYYLVTLLSLIMIFLPMNASFSLDAARFTQLAQVPRWTIATLRLQVGLVYFFAGLSKIKYDWLIEAEPLRVWLGACRNIPIAGNWLAMPVTAWVFSWVGMLFDLTAPFLLLYRRTRPYEYILIVVFHLVTIWLFYIGIFPLVMMGVALVFFSPEFHRKILKTFFFWLSRSGTQTMASPLFSIGKICWILGIYFFWQTVIPLRHFFYRGNSMWTEQGYRYAWNVMLMEKDGYVEFYVVDRQTGERRIEYPKKYLTPLQEKMMSTQPDMILQFAHFLAEKYRKDLGHPVAVYADAYASLNRHSGQSLIDPAADLALEEDSFAEKEWISALADQKPGK